MKVQYASDLHLELRANREWLRENPLEVTGDVLLLAGDISTFTTNPIPNEDFWNWCSDNYKQVLVVPGNHEYYCGVETICKCGYSFKRPLSENVAYYHNKVVRIEDTDFILSTLWSFIPNRVVDIVREGLNDFYQINFDRATLTVSEYNSMYEYCVRFIRRAVRESTAKHIVVCTHHAPSLLTVATEHLASPLSAAFASDLHYLMEDGRIDYWVYGHSHTNVNCVVHKTNIVCNQLGYVEHNGQMAGFRLDKYFEI